MCFKMLTHILYYIHGTYYCCYILHFGHLYCSVYVVIKPNVSFRILTITPTYRIHTLIFRLTIEKKKNERCSEPTYCLTVASVRFPRLFVFLQKETSCTIRPEVRDVGGVLTYHIHLCAFGRFVLVSVTRLNNRNTVVQPTPVGH